MVFADHTQVASIPRSQAHSFGYFVLVFFVSLRASHESPCYDPHYTTSILRRCINSYVCLVSPHSNRSSQHQQTLRPLAITTIRCSQLFTYDPHFARYWSWLRDTLLLVHHCGAARRASHESPCCDPSVTPCSSLPNSSLPYHSHCANPDNSSPLNPLHFVSWGCAHASLRTSWKLRYLFKDNPGPPLHSKVLATVRAIVDSMEVYSIHRLVC